MQAVLQTKRKLHAEGVRPFPGRGGPAAGASAGSSTTGSTDRLGRGSLAPSPSPVDAVEAEGGSPALRGGFAEDAKAVSNDLQLLVDLVGPDGLGDEEIAELMRLSTSAPTETPGFLRLDQSKLPLEMFDDEVRAGPTACAWGLPAVFGCGWRAGLKCLR